MYRSFDIMMRIKVVNDSTTITDSIRKTLMRTAANDITTITDAAIVSLDKLITDNTTITDNISKSTTRPVTDLTYIQDVISKRVNKVPSSSVGILDSIKINRDIVKVFTDILTINDNITKETNIYKTDAFTLDSLVTSTSGVLYDKNNVTFVSDAYQFLLEKNITSSNLIEDIINIHLNKPIESNTGITDNFFKELTKNIEDTPSLLDTYTIAVNKQLVDLATMSSYTTLQLSKQINSTTNITDDIIIFKTSARSTLQFNNSTFNGATFG